ncbi:hypothetical protein EJB05_13451, partial [Eragrostis curvula]
MELDLGTGVSSIAIGEAEEVIDLLSVNFTYLIQRIANAISMKTCNGLLVKTSCELGKMNFQGICCCIQAKVHSNEYSLSGDDHEFTWD